MRQYYVYVWLDQNVPFYVGKGHGYRASVRKHGKRVETRRKRSEEAGQFRIDYVFQGSEFQCLEIEKFLIASYGSVINGGLLMNFTEGGDGLTSSNNLPQTSKIAMIEGGRKGGYNSKPSLKSQRAGGASQGKANVESGHLLKLSKTKYKCLVTGYISNASGLSAYQRHRGIDTSLREKL